MNHQWIKKDNDYITNACQTLSRAQMAKHLKVSIAALSTHISKMGLRKHEAWTDADNAYIRRHYKRDTCVVMAEFFGCTPNTMRTQLWNLKLTRYKSAWVGIVTPPPQLDLMHREVYVPKPWICPRDDEWTQETYPSVWSTQATYRDRSHP